MLCLHVNETASSPQYSSNNMLYVILDAISFDTCIYAETTFWRAMSLEFMHMHENTKNISVKNVW